MLSKKITGYAFGVFAGICLSSINASATTLQEALIQAYRTNPSLEVSRANLRSQDESVVQAGAGMRPSVNVSGTAGYTEDFSLLDEDMKLLSASLSAQLVIYDGGRTEDAVNAAANMVFASRENLKASSQSVLLNAATAYLDVRRDEKALALSENDVAVVEQQVKAMEDRFAVGAVTRTDVALAQARLAAAKTGLAASSGLLSISKEVYRAIIGAEPKNLQPAPALPKLPQSQAEAESIAMREHPSIKAARYAEKASEYDVERARAAYMPTVSVGGSLEVSNINGFDRNQAKVSINGQMPIYQGGVLSGSMRSAAQVLESRKATTQNVMRQIRQATASSWANMRVAKASITTAELQIEARQIAYEGIKEATRLGSQTTLDLMDAEQNLLKAKSDLTSAQRDEYVAALNLLSSMGLLSVENLKLGIPAYDPEVNFKQVTSPESVSFSGSRVLDAISDRWK